MSDLIRGVKVRGSERDQFAQQDEAATTATAEDVVIAREFEQELERLLQELNKAKAALSQLGQQQASAVDADEFDEEVAEVFQQNGAEWEKASARVERIEKVYEKSLQDWMKIQEQKGAQVQALDAEVLPRTARRHRLTLNRLAQGDADTKYEDPELQAAYLQGRSDGFGGLLRFVFQDGVNNPWLGFKNLLAVARRFKPELLSGLNQTQLAVILDETRAAVSVREISVVEGQLEKFGVPAFLVDAGLKSPKDRAAYARAQRGNQNRRKKK